MKTLAVVIGIILASVGVAFALFIAFMIFGGLTESYSRGDAYNIPPAKPYIYMCDYPSPLLVS